MTKTASQKARAKMAKNQQQQTKQQKRKNNPNNNNRSNNSNSTISFSTGSKRDRTIIAPNNYGTLSTGSSFEVNRGKMKDSILIRGKDYIGSVTTASANNVMGSTIRLDYLNPAGGSFMGTRLEQFANLYEKFLFKRVRVHYNPVVPSSTAGNILLAFDKDFADVTPQATEIGLRQFMAFQGSFGGPVWQPFSMDVVLSDLQDFYYTNDSGYDGRLVYQGQLYTVAATDLTASTKYGYLTIEYEIELFDPQIESASSYSMLQGTGNSPATAGSAWNMMNPLYLADGVKPITDQSGNKGIFLPQGKYLIEQIISASSIASAFSSPTMFVNSLGLSPTLTNLITPPNSVGSSTRMDSITVPVGGASIFGNTTNNPTTLTLAGLRVIESLQGQLW